MAANTEYVLEREILQKGEFELFQIVAQATAGAAPFRFQIQDTGFPSQLFNDLLPVNTVAGFATKPHEIPVSYIFSRNRSIRITALNGVTAANTATITLIGATRRAIEPGDNDRLIYDGERADVQAADFRGQFFTYGLQLNFNVGNNQVLNRMLTIYNHADFELFYITHNHAAASPYTLQLEDLASGRRLFNEPVPNQLIAGSLIAGLGLAPYRLPVTRIFPKAGSIAITATNGPASGIHTGWLCLIGAHLERNQ